MGAELLAVQHPGHWAHAEARAARRAGKCMTASTPRGTRASRPTLKQPSVDPIRSRRPRRGLGVSGEQVEQFIAPRSLVDEELHPPSIGLEAEPDRCGRSITD
jgi:hypothetical protein